MNRDKLFRALVTNLRRHGAKSIAVFGSYARHQEKKSSDIDLIVKFKKQKSLMELVGIELELGERVGKKIELLTEKSISPYIIGQVKKEMVVLYK